MTKVHVTALDGSVSTIEAVDDQPLMRSLRDADFDAVIALCGGMCSCGTCQIRVLEGPDWLMQTGSQDEDELLEMSENRQVGSRLSCQIPVTPNLDGIRIALVQND